MRESYTKRFRKKPEDLIEMLSLYQNNVSGLLIAKKFKVHHSIVYFWVKKLGIKREPMTYKERWYFNKKSREAEAAEVEKKVKMFLNIPMPSTDKYDHIINRNINEGTSYEEYVESAKKPKTRPEILAGL